MWSHVALGSDGADGPLIRVPDRFCLPDPVLVFVSVVFSCFVLAVSEGLQMRPSLRRDSCSVFSFIKDGMQCVCFLEVLVVVHKGQLKYACARLMWGEGFIV